MDLLSNILRNPYRRETITGTRLYNHGINHVEILTGKNGDGQFDSMISETTAVIVDFAENITGEASDIIKQKAKTSILDNTKLQFEMKVHRDYPIIMSKYFKDTTEFKEFFPYGLNEFNKITKEKFTIISGRYLETLTTYQGGLITAQMITDITAIRNNYISARALQTDKKADLKSDRLEAKVDRVPLEDQLFKNIHTLTAMHYQHPELVYEYFDMTLLFPHTHAKAEPYTVTVPAGRAVDSGLTNIVGKTARFKNNGVGPIMIYTVADLNHLEPVDSHRAFIMQSDEETEKLISDIGSPNDPYLIIRNLSDLTEAVVAIEWVE